MRSRKGVTPAIATVLLIGIVVSSTGAAFTFIMTSQGEITDNLESDLTNTELRENTRFNIESIERASGSEPVYEVKVRNTGSVEINMSSQNLDVFVDDQRLEDIEVENEDGENILTPNEAGTASIQVTSENPRIRFIGPYDSSDTFIFSGGEDNWPDIDTGYCEDEGEGLFENGQAQCDADTGDIIKGENLDNYNLENADTSDIQNMRRMFHGASNFNQDIGDWDTSNVENMSRTFKQANSFNQDIGSWDTSNVKSMYQIFYGASDFNQDIGDWDTSNVETMYGVFRSATSFNQNISEWDTSDVKDMGSMFNRAHNFNQDISSWDTSNVKGGSKSGMWHMFYDARSFDQDISSWCVKNIDSKPYRFDLKSGFQYKTSKQPNWGDTC